MKKYSKSLSLVIIAILLIATSLTVMGATATDDLGSWVSQNSMSVARTSVGVVEVNGMIYAIGGYNGNNLSTVEEYDPVTDTWTTKTDMPTARKYCGVAEANGKIYVIGGDDNSSVLSTVEEYDPVTDTWTTKANMSTARVHFGVAEANGKIYAIGGYNSSVLSTVEEYDPVTDTWTTKTDMPTERKGLEVVEANGKIYAIGGYNGNYLTTVEEYDPVTDTWITKADMSTARQYFRAAEAKDKIYAIGGYHNDDVLSTVEEYDPVTDTWTTKADMPTARSHCGVAEANGMIYVIGGYNGSSILSIVEAFSTLQVTDAPTNLVATAGNGEVSLSWDSITGATRYNIKKATTSGGVYTNVAETVSTSYSDTSVTNGTIYYYVVTAVDVNGESDNSNEVSATPITPPASNTILKLTLDNEIVKEYKILSTEVDSFIAWYNNRINGSGNGYYIFDIDSEDDPYTSRNEYILFDKIIYFEVMEY